MALDLLAIRQIRYQNPNQWEFYITDAPLNLKFNLVDSTLPFEKLETETRTTGSKHYTGFTAIGDFSLTFRETTGFDIYTYFKTWQDSIYDPTRRVFNTGPKDRTAILAFEHSPTVFGSNYNKVFQFNRLKFKGFEDKSLDYTTTDAMTLTVSLTADEVVPIDLSVSGIKNAVATLKSVVNTSQATLKSGTDKVANFLYDVQKLL